MSRKRVISGLRASSERVGRLYPILLDKHGNVIDGQHRLAADEGWPKVRLEGVETEEQRLLARLVSNVCRRPVPAGEKRKLLGRLGEIYLKEGVEPKEIAGKIMEKTGMSYPWVMKYLPDKYKAEPEKGRRSKIPSLTNVKVLRRRTEEEELLLTAPPEEKVLTVRKYANTHFVNVMVEKPFYSKFERAAERLGTTPDVLISNVLLLALKRLEGRTRRKP